MSQLTCPHCGGILDIDDKCVRCGKKATIKLSLSDGKILDTLPADVENIINQLNEKLKENAYESNESN